MGNRGCTPAYWAFLADHKPKHLNSQEAVADYNEILKLDEDKGFSGFRPFERDMIAVSDVPTWVCDDIQVRDGEPFRGQEHGAKVGIVKPKEPDFQKWLWGVYQQPVWLGGSRTGKKDSAKRKCKKKADNKKRQNKKTASWSGHSPNAPWGYYARKHG